MQTPHSHEMTDVNRFPDASLKNAENYCRNPNRRASGPWCYTSDNNLEWETCGIPLCTATGMVKI